LYWIQLTQSLALRIRTYGFFNCYGQLHDHILRPILQPNFDLVQSFTDSLTISNAKKCVHNEFTQTITQLNTIIYQ